MSVLRAFIAIALPPEIHHDLDNLIKDLKSRMPHAPIRWVQAQNIHLTIKFLGNVSVANQDLLISSLTSEASRHTTFELSVGKLGVFPSIHHPKVIWVGIEAPDELYALHRGVESEMARLGYAPEERLFSPHLTLGRVSRNASSEEFQQISHALSQCKVGFLGALRVHSLELFRSDLKPSGAVYTRLISAPLLINAAG